MGTAQFVLCVFEQRLALCGQVRQTIPSGCKML